MKKRLLALALALVMVLALVPTAALAADSDFVIQDGVLEEYTGPGGAVTIPDSVTEVPPWAFEGCDNLTSLSVSGNHPCFMSQDGVLFSKDGTTLLVYPKGKTGAYSVPNGVTEISAGAFEFCLGLTSITFPTSVTAIRSSAFYGCTSLTDIYYAGSEEEWLHIEIESYDDDVDTILWNTPIHYNSASTTPTQPAAPATYTASPTNDALTVDGAAAAPTAYKINGSNYFKLRDMAALLNGSAKEFDVGYDDATKSVTITTGKGYTKLASDLQPTPAGTKAATVSNNAVYIDGVKLELTVYKINGSNYFKLRDLGQKLDFYVGWEAGRGMFIETDKSYDPAS